MYLASLILGFAAWGLPLLGMLRRKNYTSGSFALSTASLYLQFWQHDILVDKGDWSAIEDTSNGILFGATVLVAVTALLNLMAALRRKA